MSETNALPHIYVEVSVDLAGLDAVQLAELLQGKLWDVARTNKDLEDRLRDSDTHLGTLDRMIDWLLENPDIVR